MVETEYRAVSNRDDVEQPNGSDPPVLSVYEEDHEGDETLNGDLAKRGTFFHENSR